MPSKRDAKFVELRNNGLSNVDIAKKYGISRERVRQILNRLNYVGKPDLRYKKCTPEQAEFALRRKRAFIRHWQKRNPERVSVYRKNYSKNRCAHDENFYMRKVLASRIRQALRKRCGLKSGRTMELIGCTVEYLRQHLERQFQPGMTWDNWSIHGWHIDHIRPCASFDLTDPKQQAQCFHYTNLQPLWAKDNMMKKDRWEGDLNETSI